MNYSVSTAAITCKVYKHIIFIFLVITHKYQLSWRGTCVPERKMLLQQQKTLIFCEEDRDCNLILRVTLT